MQEYFNEQEDAMETKNIEPSLITLTRDKEKSARKREPNLK